MIFPAVFPPRGDITSLPSPNLPNKEALQEGTLLNGEQHQRLDEVIKAKYKYIPPEGLDLPEYTFHLPNLVKELIKIFGNRFLRISATGGAALYAMRGPEGNLPRDCDICIELIEGFPEGDIKSAIALFLQNYLRIQRMNMGRNVYFYQDGKKIYQSGKQAPLFMQIGLEALYTDPMSTIAICTIPCSVGGIARNIDLCIVVSNPDSPLCHSSANSIRCNLNYLLEEGKSPCAFSVDGYTFEESMELLDRQLFTVDLAKIPKIRNGLHGYIHQLTCGLTPNKWEIERCFIEQFIKECLHKTAKTFEEEIKKHIERHYQNKPEEDLFYLCNYMGILEEAPDFPQKNALLGILQDQFANRANIPNTPQAIELKRLLIFWEAAEDLNKTRRDDPTGKHTSRYKFGSFQPNGSRRGLFLPLPWKKTLEFLGIESTKRDIKTAQRTLADKLKNLPLCKNPKQVQLAQLICQLEFTPKEFAQIFLKIQKPLEESEKRALEKLLKIYHPNFEIDLDHFSETVLKNPYWESAWEHVLAKKTETLPPKPSDPPTNLNEPLPSSSEPPTPPVEKSLKDLVQKGIQFSYQEFGRRFCEKCKELTSEERKELSELLKKSHPDKWIDLTAKTKVAFLEKLADSKNPEWQTMGRILLQEIIEKGTFEEIDKLPWKLMKSNALTLYKALQKRNTPHDLLQKFEISLLKESYQSEVFATLAQNIPPELPSEAWLSAWENYLIQMPKKPLIKDLEREDSFFKQEWFKKHFMKVLEKCRENLGDFFPLLNAAIKTDAISLEDAYGLLKQFSAKKFPIKEVFETLFVILEKEPQFLRNKGVELTLLISREAIAKSDENKDACWALFSQIVNMPVEKKKEMAKLERSALLLLFTKEEARKKEFLQELLSCPSPHELPAFMKRWREVQMLTGTAQDELPPHIEKWIEQSSDRTQFFLALSQDYQQTELRNIVKKNLLAQIKTREGDLAIEYLIEQDGFTLEELMSLAENEHFRDKAIDKIIKQPNSPLAKLIQLAMKLDPPNLPLGEAILTREPMEAVQLALKSRSKIQWGDLAQRALQQMTAFKIEHIHLLKQAIEQSLILPDDAWNKLALSPDEKIKHLPFFLKQPKFNQQLAEDLLIQVLENNPKQSAIKEALSIYSDFNELKAPPLEKLLIYHAEGVSDKALTVFFAAYTKLTEEERQKEHLQLPKHLSFIARKAAKIDSKWVPHLLTLIQDAGKDPLSQIDPSIICNSLSILCELKIIEETLQIIEQLVNRLSSQFADEEHIEYLTSMLSLLSRHKATEKFVFSVFDRICENENQKVIEKILIHILDEKSFQKLSTLLQLANFIKERLEREKILNWNLFQLFVALQANVNKSSAAVWETITHEKKKEQAIIQERQLGKDLELFHTVFMQVYAYINEPNGLFPGRDFPLNFMMNSLNTQMSTAFTYFQLNKQDVSKEKPLQMAEDLWAIAVTRNLAQEEYLPSFLFMLMYGFRHASNQRKMEIPKILCDRYSPNGPFQTSSDQDKKEKICTMACTMAEDEDDLLDLHHEVFISLLDEVLSEPSSGISGPRERLGLYQRIIETYEETVAAKDEKRCVWNELTPEEQNTYEYEAKILLKVLNQLTYFIKDARKHSPDPKDPDLNRVQAHLISHAGYIKFLITHCPTAQATWSQLDGKIEQVLLGL